MVGMFFQRNRLFDHLIDITAISFPESKGQKQQTLVHQDDKIWTADKIHLKRNYSTLISALISSVLSLPLKQKIKLLFSIGKTIFTLEGRTQDSVTMILTQPQSGKNLADASVYLV